MFTVWDLPPNMRSKVRLSTVSDCWVWTGSKQKAGYGHVRRPGKPNADRRGSGIELAHRYAHEAVLGPIPEGHHVDHLCRNHACVNPAHLETVPPRENYRRGRAARSTHCVAGHELTYANTYVDLNGRACKACIQVRTEAVA
jgi:hypothetical protein